MNSISEKLDFERILGQLNVKTIIYKKLKTIQEVNTMDKKRAKIIASSPVMVNVTYNGAPVYIENVNESNDTAKIYLLNQPKNRQEVPITSLIENYTLTD